MTTKWYAKRVGTSMFLRLFSLNKHVIKCFNILIRTQIYCAQLVLAETRTGGILSFKAKMPKKKTKLCGFLAIHCHYDFTNVGYLCQYLQDVTQSLTQSNFHTTKLTNKHP